MGSSGAQSHSVTRIPHHGYMNTRKTSLLRLLPWFKKQKPSNCFPWFVIVSDLPYLVLKPPQGQLCTVSNSASADIARLLGEGPWLSLCASVFLFFPTVPEFPCGLFTPDSSDTSWEFLNGVHLSRLCLWFQRFQQFGPKDGLVQRQLIPSHALHTYVGS